MNRIVLFIFLFFATHGAASAQITPESITDTIYGVALRLAVNDMVMYAIAGKDTAAVEKLPVLDAYPTEVFCIRRRTPVGPEKTYLTVEARYYTLRKHEEIPVDDILVFKIRPPFGRK